MSNNIQTSTPIVFPKLTNQEGKDRNAWNKYISPQKSSPWDLIESPKFIDFGERLSEVRDSFFDRRQSDYASPQRKEIMVLPTPDDTIEMVDSFKSCSISTVVKSSTEDEDMTLVADDAFPCIADENDCHVSFETPRKSQKHLDVVKSDRRLSMVQPFSFELREKEIQERRESRRLYHERLSEQFRLQQFNAKPAPKFRHLSTTAKTPTNAHDNSPVNTAINVNHNGVTLEITPKRIRVPRKTDVNANTIPEKKEIHKVTVQPTKLIKSTGHPAPQKAKGATIPVKPHGRDTAASKQFSATNSSSVQSKFANAVTSTKIAATAPVKFKHPSNPFSFNAKTIISTNPMPSNQSVKTTLNPSSLQARTRNATNPFQGQKPNNSAVTTRVTRPEKANSIQKPFQVTLPHRKIEIPKPLTLLTEKRARERQLFDERIKERERQREENKKLELAAQQAREREEFARLRKQTVFKAKPVPQFKRQLTDAMIPIVPKRRRVQ